MIESNGSDDGLAEECRQLDEVEPLVIDLVNSFKSRAPGWRAYVIVDKEGAGLVANGSISNDAFMEVAIDFFKTDVFMYFDFRKHMEEYLESVGCSDLSDISERYLDKAYLDVASGHFESVGEDSEEFDDEIPF